MSVCVYSLCKPLSQCAGVAGETTRSIRNLLLLLVAVVIVVVVVVVVVVVWWLWWWRLYLVCADSDFGFDVYFVDNV